MADPHQLLKRIQHCETDGCDCGGSHFRVNAYTVRGQICPRLLSDGIGRKTRDRLLQCGTTRGCREVGVVLHAAPTGTEADPGGVQAKRCGGIRLPRSASEWKSHPILWKLCPSAGVSCCNQPEQNDCLDPEGVRAYAGTNRTF